MKIRDNIYSVGVRDKELRILHGYETPIGSTYNAYLVLDDKITLIDFVKAPFTNEFIANIKEVIGDKAIDCIICNHAEPDHSGALPAIAQLYPEAAIYCTANCSKELKAYYPEIKQEYNIVKNGDTLNTGKYELNFIPMPMVHWPDSMSTYLPQEKILFCNDALGQHIGTGEYYDTDLGEEKLLDRAADYYANIVLPYGMQVGKLLAAITPLDIEMACPSHGAILTKFLPKIIAKYQSWSQNQTDPKKMVIIYDTMWGTTQKIAEKLGQENQAKGLDVELINLSEKHISYAMARILEAQHIYVGSPTLNNGIMPTVAAFLTYMKGLKPKNRQGLAFGSYGWSGESAGQINETLASCGFEMQEPMKVMWNF